MKKVRAFIETQSIYGLISFLVPIIIMASIYRSIGIYPGSEDRTIFSK